MNQKKIIVSIVILASYTHLHCMDEKKEAKKSPPTKSSQNNKSTSNSHKKTENSPPKPISPPQLQLNTQSPNPTLYHEQQPTYYYPQSSYPYDNYNYNYQNYYEDVPPQVFEQHASNTVHYLKQIKADNKKSAELQHQHNATMIQILSSIEKKLDSLPKIADSIESLTKMQSEQLAILRQMALFKAHQNSSLIYAINQTRQPQSDKK